MTQNIYDCQSFFNQYIEMRKKNVNANELIEIPIFKEILPNIKNKSILDLGCGFGDMCQYYIKEGAKSVLGVDISQKMIDLAINQNKSSKIDFRILKMEELSLLNQEFDIITSSLAFHYVEDYEKLIKDIYKLLKPEGILLFSNEHPLTTCPIRSEKISGLKHIDIEGKRYYLISDYNNNGARITNWNSSDVIKYHRSFSALINPLVQNGFMIEIMKESYADDNAVKKVEKYKYQQDRPFFVYFRARKSKEILTN